jgi:hypothetical protein
MKQFPLYHLFSGLLTKTGHIAKTCPEMRMGGQSGKSLNLLSLKTPTISDRRQYTFKRPEDIRTLDPTLIQTVLTENGLTKRLTVSIMEC